MSILGLITCPVCSKERLKRYDPYKHPNKMVKCLKCSAKGNNNGGREIHRPFKSASGHLMLWISKRDFFFPMASRKVASGNYGYISEHRLVMARHLGRCLQRWENVHHKNGGKVDNRIENLELTASNSEHSTLHSKGYKDGYNRGLADGRLKQIQLLKEEIRRLTNDR